MAPLTVYSNYISSAEIINQFFTAILRLIVDDLAFTLQSFANFLLDNISGNQWVIIIFSTNSRQQLEGLPMRILWIMGLTTCVMTGAGRIAFYIDLYQGGDRLHISKVQRY